VVDEPGADPVDVPVIADEKYAFFVDFLKGATAARRGGETRGCSSGCSRGPVKSVTGPTTRS